MSDPQGGEENPIIPMECAAEPRCGALSSHRGRFERFANCGPSAIACRTTTRPRRPPATSSHIDWFAQRRSMSSLSGSDLTVRGATEMKCLLAAAWVVAGLIAWTDVASAQDGPVMRRIAETKTINIGHRDASVPISYIGPDGNVQGYSIDICLRIVDAAKEELKLERLDIKYVPVTPQTRIPLLTAGTVDIICETSTHTLGRSRQVSFLNITFLTGSKLLVRKSSGIKRIEDLTDKVLVAVLGGTNGRAAKVEIETKKISIKGEMLMVKDNAQAMLNLEQGRADAFTSDDVVLYGLKSASKNPDEWEVVGPYFSYDPYGMMIPRNNDDFRLLGNKTIARLIESGEIEAIYKKWFEPGPTNINYPLSDRLKENFRLMAFPD
jgi:glutamate/aspartate transport system substrate-binding protein